MSLHRDCRRVQSGKFSGGGDRHVVFDTEEVTGSNPVSPTKKHQVEGLIAETAIKPLIVCHLGVIGTACHQVFKSVTGRQLLIFD